jgi:hypothetical protein
MSEGMKFDEDKARWDLLPWDEIEDIVDVLTYGAKKYDADNWKSVSDPFNRYFSAMHRHIRAWDSGQSHDVETNKHHLAHAMCCLLFLLWFTKQEER